MASLLHYPAAEIERELVHLRKRLEHPAYHFLNDKVYYRLAESAAQPQNLLAASVPQGKRSATAARAARAASSASSTSASPWTVETYQRPSGNR